MKSKLKVYIGDRARFVLNGEPKEMEVVDILPPDKNLEGKMAFALSIQDVLGRGYLEKINLQLPDGRIIEGRPFQPTF